MHPTLRGFVNHDYARTTVRSVLLVLALLPLGGGAVLLMETGGRSMEEPVLFAFLASMVVWLVVLLRSFVIRGEWTVAPGGLEMRWRRLLGRRRERTVAWGDIAEYVSTTDLYGRPCLKVVERSGLDHTVYGRNSRKALERFAAFEAAFLERVQRQNLAAAPARAEQGPAPAPAPIREGRSVYLHPLARPAAVAAVLLAGGLVTFLTQWEPASGASVIKAASLLVLALAFAGRVFTARAPLPRSSGPSTRA